MCGVFEGGQREGEGGEREKECTEYLHYSPGTPAPAPVLYKN